MLHWAILFLLLAVVAGLLGFTTIAGTALGLAKVCFVLFIIIFIILVLAGRSAF